MKEMIDWLELRISGTQKLMSETFSKAQRDRLSIALETFRLSLRQAKIIAQSQEAKQSELKL